MAKNKTVVKAQAKPQPRNVVGRIAAAGAPIGAAAEKLANLMAKKRKK